jgi:hypothetical protein
MDFIDDDEINELIEYVPIWMEEMTLLKKKKKQLNDNDGKKNGSSKTFHFVDPNEYSSLISSARYLTPANVFDYVIKMSKYKHLSLDQLESDSKTFVFGETNKDDRKFKRKFRRELRQKIEKEVISWSDEHLETLRSLPNKECKLLLNEIEFQLVTFQNSYFCKKI